MSKERKREPEGKGSEFEFGIGDFSLGGLFKGIEKLIDLAAAVKEAGGEIKKEGEIDLSRLKPGAKGVFGFSVRTAEGGKAVVSSFGNIKRTPQGPTVEEVREPLIDVFDEKDEIRVYAEMPGVNKTDIKLDLKDDILDISAQSGDRKYHKEVLLPVKLQAENLIFSYKNGILEVKIKK